MPFWPCPRLTWYLNTLNLPLCGFCGGQPAKTYPPRELFEMENFPKLALSWDQSYAQESSNRSRNSLKNVDSEETKMNRPRQHVDTILADISASDRTLRQRLMSRLREARAAQNGEMSGGPPPTQLLRFYLNQVLQEEISLADLSTELRARERWPYGRTIARHLERAVGFIRRLSPEILVPYSYGAFDLPIGPFRAQLHPHASLMVSGVTTDVIVYTTQSVQLERRYWGAYQALGRFLREQANVLDRRLLFFDATSDVWINPRRPDATRAQFDEEQLNLLLERRLLTWEAILDQRGISDPFDDEEARRD